MCRSQSSVSTVMKENDDGKSGTSGLDCARRTSGLDCRGGAVTALAGGIATILVGYVAPLSGLMRGR